MPKKSKSKSSLDSTPSPFEREMQISGRAIGIVIGKGGSTLKSFKEIPGITSVKCSSNGKIQIHGDSQEAVETVSCAIEQLVSFSLDKNNGYFPDFFSFCFSKTVHDPLLAVNRACFEKFSNNISNLSARDTASRRSFFCLKSAEFSEDLLCAGQDEVDVLSKEFADKTAKVFFHSNWNFSAYKQKLQSCIEPLLFYRIEMDSTRSIKLIVRYGKELFCGANWSELHQEDFTPVDHLQDLCRRELLDQRFSTACSDKAVKDLKSLHLQTLGYQREKSCRKISIIVADLQSRQLQFNVSARVEGNEGFDEKIVITRVQNQPKRHGFVTFCREGSATTDFRLGVMTHGTDLNPAEEMVEWIERAWRNRTPDRLLVFDPPGRFLVMNIRYKESDTYVTEGWKFRIVKVGDGDRSNKLSNRRDCALGSRWFKRNVDKIEGDNMDLAMENVAELVIEAAKISRLMDSKGGTYSNSIFSSSNYCFRSIQFNFKCTNQKNSMCIVLLSGTYDNYVIKSQW